MIWQGGSGVEGLYSHTEVDFSCSVGVADCARAGEWTWPNIASAAATHASTLVPSFTVWTRNFMCRGMQDYRSCDFLVR